MPWVRWIVPLVLLTSTVAVAREPVIDYSRDVRPVLARNCFSCHGPDAEGREGGLRLDDRDSALAAGDSGTSAIVPGQPEASELIRRISSKDEFERMPPKETGKSLTSDEIQLIERWIQQGASYSDHWSFRPIQDPPLPQVRETSWPRNGIDYFVLARLEQEQLTPSPEASRETLIRRLSLDLIGLPPTFEAVQTFVNDSRPDAYERLVDELLDSPHFGERWGRHWLDLARYADSNGYLGDELRPEAYHFRDWVIQAINDDLPFRQFTIEQIAGDLLPNATQSQRIAAGFHRNAMKNTEAGVDREADRVIQTVDRISTVGTAWLGLTLGCAECHSHKFDPISHQEFFELYAFFNNLDEDSVQIGVIPAPPETPQELAEREKKLAAIVSKLKAAGAFPVGEAEDYQARILATLAQPKGSRAEQDVETLENWRADLSPAARKLSDSYEKLAQQRPKERPVLAPSVRESSKKRVTRIHHRGDFRQPRDEVQPSTPKFLGPFSPRGSKGDRLDLAEWIVREDHPLTWRVAVNHVWLHLFGEGLVRTPDNFGQAGGEPSHPELIDWLAVRFQESGGSRKALIRLIVTSATYRQSSEMTSLLARVDPQNVLLARQSRLRLEAEIVRDCALAASGLLNPRIGGPSIRPPANTRANEVSRNADWVVSPGAEKYRRGLYILFRRATPFSMLTLFDSPDSTTACARRERSNSPLQSLTLLNDPVFFECAQHLGAKFSWKEMVPPEEWISDMFERTLSRSPSQMELERLVQLYDEHQQLLRECDKASLRKIVVDDVQGPIADAAARVLMARTLMNLDEFITRE